MQTCQSTNGSPPSKGLRIQKLLSPQGWPSQLVLGIHQCGGPCQPQAGRETVLTVLQLKGPGENLVWSRSYRQHTGYLDHQPPLVLFVGAWGRHWPRGSAEVIQTISQLWTWLWKLRGNQIWPTSTDRTEVISAVPTSIPSLLGGKHVIHFCL